MPLTFAYLEWSIFLKKQLLSKGSIDALILVTQSPDHFMPPTSHIIHGKLDLKQDMICMDINQGCSGYVIGLNQAFFSVRAR